MMMGLCIVLFWMYENHGKVFSNSASKTTIPKAKNALNWLPSSNGMQIVHHQNYSLAYNEKHEQAGWVAYTLKKEHITNDDRKRPYFEIDDQVHTTAAHWRNYKGSGYDRGHLCPAGDRRFSLDAYNETFLTSNISPQDHDFNSGVWNRLEIQTRRWAKKYGQIQVVTAGILHHNLPTIGTEAVSIPDYFYKILYRKKGDQHMAIAFKIPHRESNKPLFSFLVSIDQLEQETGIDFFQNFADTEEAKFERSIHKTNWKF